MKYLILLLISFSASANYVKISDFESGTIAKVFTKMKRCGSSCMKIPSGYNKNFHKRVEILKQDLDSPIVSKSEITTCIDDQDCQNKLELKNCTDTAERAVKVTDTDPQEVYCTKTTYPMIGSGSFYVVEDAALKASWKDAKKAKKDAKKAKRDEARVNLKAKLKAGDDLTKPQLRKVLIHLLGD